MPHIAPWFPERRFGIFIHWVLNAVWMDDQAESYGYSTDPADPNHPRNLARRFTAERYDPKQWAKLFKSWGAGYAVLTTKHHIGFALFDHPDSPFTSARDSAAARDLIKPYCDALRAEGLKVGLYYSLPDWSHPDYASLAGGTDPKKYSTVDEPLRWKRFTDHMFAEIEHLCTAYGGVDLLWFDGDWERSAEQWRTLELAERIQTLVPHVVLNNRLRHICLGHYGTPESSAPLKAPGGWWEYCTTPGDNWDGPGANTNVKPASELVRMVCDMVGMGGNMLLNIAPSADGTIPQPQLDQLQPMGDWINANREAIVGSEAGLDFGLFNGTSTRRGSVLYLIAYDQPRDELVVKGIKSSPSAITVLRTGRKLEWRTSGGRPKFGRPGWLFIKLPEDQLDRFATVIRIEFENDVLEYERPGGGTQKYTGRPVLEEKELDRQTM